METLWRDFRYGLRRLLKRPGFTAVAVVTLALGIGANTTIFSVVNGILLRPLPGISRPDRLIDVHATAPNGSSFHSFSHPEFLYYREQTKLLDGLIAYTGKPFNMSAGGQPERVYGMFVSGNYFDVLGTRPAQGRFFLPEEDQTPGTHPVVVLSYGVWQQRFGSNPAIIGQNVTLNSRFYSVIGIAPDGFRGTLAGVMPDIWVPLMMRSGAELEERGSRGLEMIGRLKDGVTIPQVQGTMTSLAKQLAEAYPDTNRGLGVDVRPASQVPGQVRGAVIGFMAILMLIVGLVLLIACTNVGAMTLARASARRKELAVRLAVGASRWRIIRQLLIESVLLFLIGGGVGILLAVWAIRFLLAYKLPADVPVSFDLGLDFRVLLFTLLVSLGTGFVFGLAPAFQASKTDVLSALKNDSAAGTGRSRVRSAFVVAQIAISLVLLITAALFLRSLRNASTIELGFHPEGVETITFDLHTQGYKEAQGRQFYRELQQRVAALPGVRSVSLARMVPLNGSNMKASVNVTGNAAPEEQRTTVGFNVVDSRYFETIEMPVLRGRSFSDADKEGAPAVAIINETMARRFYPGDDLSAALGKSLGGLERDESGRVEIVGIVKDAKYDTLGEDPQPFVYRPYQQSYSGEMTMHIRTSADRATVFSAVRREVNALDKDLPLLNVMPLTDQIGVSLLPLRVAATVGGTLGFVGVILAAIGIFGIVNYSVSQRTREIGIRMALGARAWDVLTMVLRQGLWLALVGVVIGIGFSFALTRALGSLLYGVGATDPLIFIGTSLAILFVGCLASYQPARRATKVDPLVALRYE